MNTYLNQFWTWSNRTPEVYARIGMNQKQGEVEDLFPLVDDMISCAQTIVCDGVTDDSSIDDLLTIKTSPTNCVLNS